MATCDSLCLKGPELVTLHPSAEARPTPANSHKGEQDENIDRSPTAVKDEPHARVLDDVLANDQPSLQSGHSRPDRHPTRSRCELDASVQRCDREDD